MSENTDQNPQLSRRDFLKFSRDKLLQGSATMLAAKIIGTSQNQSSREENEPETIEPQEEIFTHKVNDLELSFKALPIKPIRPYVANDGKYYDLAKKQYVNSDQCTPEMLLLGEGPAFIDGRDTIITPEFVNNEVAQKIIAQGNANIQNWVDDFRNNSRSETETIDIGGIIMEKTIITDPDINFTPNQLLKLRQFEKAIAEVLVYNREAPVKMKHLSLAERLEAGATNCQEFSLTTAMILAGEPLLMPSEILHFTYELPDGTRKAHVCNVVNFNNSPVIIESTGFGVGPMTLYEYFKNYSENGIKISSPIQFTSVLAENSYQAFPWDNAEWVSAKTPLSIPAAGQSAS